jgi:hypothetical protein
MDPKPRIGKRAIMGLFTIIMSWPPVHTMRKQFKAMISSAPSVLSNKSGILRRYCFAAGNFHQCS